MGKPTKNTLLKAILTRNMLKCDMCSLQFDNKYAYDLHWSLVHSTPNVFNIKPKSRKVNKLFFIIYCYSKKINVRIFVQNTRT